jgi:hypothetical protein
MAAQTELIEAGRDFVVLFVGSARLNGDRALAKFLDEGFESLALSFRAALATFGQTLFQESPDTQSYETIRHGSILQKPIQ